MRRKYVTPRETAPAPTRCRRICVPVDADWLGLVNGALSTLIFESNWRSDGGITAVEASETFARIVYDYLRDDMIGTIYAHARSTPPDGCLPCDGALYLRSDYPLLYDTLDPFYIVSSTMFRVPDLRGRTIIGAGTGPMLSTRSVGDEGGDEAVTLNVAEIPAHTHTALPHDHFTLPHWHAEAGTVTVAIPVEPGVPVPVAQAAPSVTAAETVTVIEADVDLLDTGGGGSHNNMPPYAVLSYVIVAR